MVILLKNRAAIYQREAAEMLHNISLYPGLTEEQLCRFFPEKEATAKPLLAHMLKEGRVYCGKNGRYYANQEAQIDADKDLSRCVWVLLDFIDQVEYHTVGEFPAAILCFANGELYEIVPIPQGNQAIHAMRPIGRLRRYRRPFQRNLFAYPSDSPFIRFIIKREQIPQNVNSIYILQDLLSLLFERPLKKQKRRITNGIRI